MELQNLSEIFNERIFRIPDYQRGYSWEQKQLDDLWRDISSIESKDEYYTGLLTVDPQKDDTVHIVDGQQRITSLIILIHVILNCEQLRGEDWFINRKKSSYTEKYLHRQTGKRGEIIQLVFGYEMDNPSHIHFKTKILGLEEAEGAPTRTLYTANLDKAKKFFAEKVAELQDIDAVAVVFEKITKQLKFLYYRLGEKLNPFVAFEGMNDRGKHLSVLELLKNRLMYLSTKLPDNSETERESLRKDINEVWKVVYEFLGKHPERALGDNYFLRDHWLMYFSAYTRSKEEPFREFLLEEHFTVDQVGSGKVGYKDIRSYVLDLKKVVPAWYCTHFPDYYLHRFSTEGGPNEEMPEWLAKLERFGYYSFRPLVTSLLASDLDKFDVLAIVREVERFNFLSFGTRMRTINANSDFRASDIFRLTHGVHREDKSISPCDVSPEKLGVDQTLYTFAMDAFVDKIKEYNNDFSDWDALKYFLYEYELFLQEDKPIRQTWKDVRGRETTEHIYPQTHNKSWKHFRSAGARGHVHYLGNLMLLSRKQNSKVNNKPFSYKKERYKNWSHSAIQVANYPDWMLDTIMDRQGKMLDFLQERWKVKQPTSASHK